MGKGRKKEEGGRGRGMQIASVEFTFMVYLLSMLWVHVGGVYGLVV